MEQQVKLYSFADFDRSSRVRWLLHEINLPYEEVRLDYQKNEHKSPEYRKKNPFGIIPALEVNGDTLVESGAICNTLAEQHPELELAPDTNSPLRISYHQWCYFGCSTLEQFVMPVIRLRRMGPTDSEKEKEVIEPLNQVLQTVSNALEGKKYLVGDKFTTADIIVASTLGLARISHLR